MPAQIDLEQAFNVPCEIVFPYFSDHQTFGQRVAGAPVTRIHSSPSAEQPNGIGSVRRIGAGPIAFEETVVAFIENERIEYTISKGGPIKDHLGTIVFSATDKGCRINYHIELEGKLPLIAKPIAKLLEAGLKRNMAKLAQELGNA